MFFLPYVEVMDGKAIYIQNVYRSCYSGCFADIAARVIVVVVDDGGGGGQYKNVNEYIMTTLLKTLFSSWNFIDPLDSPLTIVLV